MAALPALALRALLAHADDALDLGVAAQVGVVDDLGEVVLQTLPPLLDELRVTVGLLPEVRPGEERQLGVELLQSLVDGLQLLEAVLADVGLVVGEVLQVHLVQHHALLNRVSGDPQQVKLVRSAEIVVSQHVLLPYKHLQLFIITHNQSHPLLASMGDRGDGLPQRGRFMLPV